MNNLITDKKAFGTGKSVPIVFADDSIKNMIDYKDTAQLIKQYVKDFYYSNEEEYYVISKKDLKIAVDYLLGFEDKVHTDTFNELIGSLLAKFIEHQVNTLIDEKLNKSLNNIFQKHNLLPNG